MRTYSHAVFTLVAAEAATRRACSSESGVASWAAAGAVLPDLPATVGAAWLAARRRRLFGRQEFCEEVCEKGAFGGPDAALHSALPVAALGLALSLASRARSRCYGGLAAFLLGWAGHVAVDALTHAGDARPLLWPVSGRRFEGPVSYWDARRHGRAFALFEHAALLVVAAAWYGSRSRG